MIVIIEGPDNAGKTTLAQYLAKQLRAVYVKIERPERAIDLLAYQNILEVANQYSGWVIADRHVAISEPIYGTIVRGKCDLKFDDIEMCLNRMHAIVYCRPLTSAIISSIAHRSQMEGVIENATRIIDAYDDFFETLILERENVIYRYNYQSDFQNDLLFSIRHYAEESHL